MPRKNNNNNKGKDLFNIQNLSAAKDILNKILEIINKSDSSAQSWMEDNEELLRLYKELDKVTNKNLKQTESGIYSRKQAFKDEIYWLKEKLDYQETELVNMRERIRLQTQEAEQQRKEAEKQKEREDGQKRLTNAIEARLKKQKEVQSFSWNNLGDTLFSKQLTPDNEKRKQAYQNILNKAESDKNFDFDKVDELLDEADNVLVQEVKGSTKGLNAAAKTLNAAGVFLKSTFTVLTDLFKQGAAEQRDIYEATFQNMAVRTGISREDYYDNQWHLNNELSDRSLRDNIGTTEVQEMWSSLANQGFSEEYMFERALDNVVTKNIVPYLDTTSLSVNLLNQRLNGDFIKQIRGINTATISMSGNTLMNSEILNKMIDQIQPMSDEAISNLASESTELSNLSNYLLNQGWDEQTVKDTVNQLYRQQQYSASIFNSGTPAEKMQYLRLVENQLNPNNTEDFTEVVNSNLQTKQDLLDMSYVPGYDNATDSLISNTWADAMGYSWAEMQNYLNKYIGDEQERESIFKLDETSFKNYIDQTNKTFEDGEYQTNEQRQDLTMENLANEFAVIQEYLGNGTKIIKGAIDGLGAVVTTYLAGKFLNSISGGVIGKGIGLLAGQSAGGSGAGLLAAGGGMALGAVAGAAALAIGAAIADSMWDSSGEQGKTQAEEQLNGTSLEGNSAATALLSTANAQIDAGEFQQTFGNVWSGVGMLFSNMFQGKGDKNKNFLQWAIQSGALNTGNQTHNMGNLYALATIYAQEGYLSSFNQGLKEAGIQGVEIESKEDIGRAMLGMGMTKEIYNNYVNNLFKAGWAKINTTSGETLTSFEIDAEAFGIKGQNGFRTGLNYVPYDNYPAILHEGEAVITANTANEMRGLVEEYRETRNQSANFEAIINNQTAALVSKLDEVIEVLSRTNSSTVNDNSFKEIIRNRRESSISNNMIHIRNSRSFANN